MPIEIYTGKPGNGKTALMMERMINEAKKGERPIFASGIDGLQPGLASVIDDPRTWNDPASGGGRVLPDGALWFVDEAWKWFGHLHDATRQATPAHVLALAEHRHRGIDMVWTSQGPNQIYPFARPLIADHYHTVRRFNTSIIDVFHWEELQEDVKSAAKRDLAQRTTRTLPSAAFGSYKSAEVHTMKRRIPWRVIALPGMLLLALFLGWFAYTKLRPDSFGKTLAGDKSPAAAQAAPGAGGSSTAGPVDERPVPKWKNSTEYAQDHLPRFASMPWTAVVYDGRSVTADPQVFCMATQAGLDANGAYGQGDCNCVTEQGTVYDMELAQCRRVARVGMPYNPYRERRDERDQAPPAQLPDRPAPMPARVAMTAPQIVAYGALPAAADGQSQAD